MKNLFVIILSLIFLGCTSSAQENGGEVPENIKNAFVKKYPGVEVQNWETDKNNYYEASFERNGTKYRADFAKDGTWIETESSFSYENLPADVKAVIDNEYKEHEIVEIELVDNAEKGTFFDIELKKNGKKRDVMLTESGKRLN